MAYPSVPLGLAIPTSFGDHSNVFAEGPSLVSHRTRWRTSADRSFSLIKSIQVDAMRSMNVNCSLVVGLLVLVGPAAGTAAEKEQTAELSWAKRVATEFF